MNLSKMILLGAALASLAAADPVPSRMPLTQQERDMLQNESQQAWKEVHWAESAALARQRAEESGQPIVVFLVVGEFGRKGAPTC